ncbi:unnamed protein product [Polarella glacialis]|uniref:Uncharacterized protein n=1 Tax=Polarella glacialis TaxID=89957 RepID=A0A813DX51_POLGL|nr:unnamed protein product [Polarella glacialis]CAE8709050.1 unnamed protein product [Polarella glacialis]
MATTSSFVDENGQTRMEQPALSDVGYRDYDVGDAPSLFQLCHRHEKYVLEPHFGLWIEKTEERRDKDAKEDSSRMFLGAKNTLEFGGSSSRTSRLKRRASPEHQAFGDAFQGFNALPDGLGMPSLPAAVSWKTAVSS